jgi:hypothetical protein
VLGILSLIKVFSVVSKGCFGDGFTGKEIMICDCDNWKLVRQRDENAEMGLSLSLAT